MIKKLVLILILTSSATIYAEPSSKLVYENLLQGLPFPSGEWSVSQGMVDGCPVQPSNGNPP